MALLRIVIISVMPLICHTHTLGSNSTATLGPGVVELIVFAALSWTVIVLIVIFSAAFCYGRAGKQSIKDHNLEFYSQTMWEDLVLVPALNTVFSLVCTIWFVWCTT